MADGGQSLFARLTLSAMRRPTTRGVDSSQESSIRGWSGGAGHSGPAATAAQPAFALHLGSPLMMHHRTPGPLGQGTGSAFDASGPATTRSLVGPVPVAPSAYRSAPAEARAAAAAAAVVAAPPVTNHSVETLQHLFTFACATCGARRQRGSHCGGCRTPLPLAQRCGRCGVTARGRFCSTCGLCLITDSHPPAAAAAAVATSHDGSRHPPRVSGDAPRSATPPQCASHSVASSSRDVRPPQSINNAGSNNMAGMEGEVAAAPLRATTPRTQGPQDAHTRAAVPTATDNSDPLGVPTRLLHSLDQFISEATRSAQSFGVPPRSRSGSLSHTAWPVDVTAAEAADGVADKEARASVFAHLQSARDVLATGGCCGSSTATAFDVSRADSTRQRTSHDLYAATAAAHAAAVGALTGYESGVGAGAGPNPSKAAYDASWAAEATRAHAAGACAVQTPRSQSPLLRPDALLAAGTGAAVGVDHLQLTREEQEQAHVAAQNPAESAWGPVDLAWRTVVRSGPPSISGPPAVRRDLEY